jgi:hypothetical protein
MGFVGQGLYGFNFLVGYLRFHFCHNLPSLLVSRFLGF